MRNTTIERLRRDSPIIALFAAAGLFSFALTALAAVPLLREYKERLDRIGHYDMYISSSNGFNAVHAELEKRNALLESKLKNVSAEIPSRVLSDILRELIRRGGECGVTLEKIQPQPNASPVNSHHIPVYLEMKTDYMKLGGYIASLEASPQIIQIRKIAIETTKRGELDARLQVNCVTEEDSADITPDHDVAALAGLALKVEIASLNTVFPHDARSPFRMLGASDPSTASGGEKRESKKQPRFRLKGLMKNPPLAILEDARGETHIRGLGERVDNAEIIAVTDRSVTFKDNSGTYELIVEDNK